MTLTLVPAVAGLLFAVLAYFWAQAERRQRSTELLELKKGYVGQIALLERELREVIKDNKMLRAELRTLVGSRGGVAAKTARPGPEPSRPLLWRTGSVPPLEEPPPDGLDPVDEDEAEEMVGGSI